MSALRAAEEQKGSPPYVVDIMYAWNSFMPKLSQFHMFVGLQDLYRNDEVLADLNNERFTLNRALQSTAENKTEYELYSDRFVRVFPGYTLD
mmetsp:Transcript_22321/g.27397  ORF Transcript_22321/g.27397 Transcript_22321/m.27397 type:complete len:92 (-) Transcript_22321:1229-1504(-)